MDDMPRGQIRYLSDRKSVNDEIMKRHIASMSAARLRRDRAAMKKASDVVKKASAASAEKKDSGSTVEKKKICDVKGPSSTRTESSSALKDVSNLPAGPAKLSSILLKKSDFSIVATKDIRDGDDARVTFACGHLKNGSAKPDKLGK